MYDKIFLPLHHQNTDRDDTPTRGKTIFYVHEKNLPRVGAKKPSEQLQTKNQTKILTSTKLKEINDDGAVVMSKDGQTKTIKADSVIISVGYKPLQSLKHELEKAGCRSKIYEIGDGKKVGNVMTCIADAFAVSFNI